MSFGVAFVILCILGHLLKMIYHALFPSSLMSENEKYQRGYELRMEQEHKNV